MKTYLKQFRKDPAYYFERQFQGGYLNIDTAILIDKAVTKLLKDQNIPSSKISKTENRSKNVIYWRD